MNKKTLPHANATGAQGNLTKREYMATLILQGLMANSGGHPPFAEDAVRFADRLIKVLNETAEASNE